MLSLAGTVAQRKEPLQHLTPGQLQQLQQQLLPSTALPPLHPTRRTVLSPRAVQEHGPATISRPQSAAPAVPSSGRAPSFAVWSYFHNFCSPNKRTYFNILLHMIQVCLIPQVFVCLGNLSPAALQGPVACGPHSSAAKYVCNYCKIFMVFPPATSFLHPPTGQYCCNSALIPRPQRC